MSSHQEAEHAKLNLNNHPLFEDGSKINVHYANFDNLKFNNNASGGVGKIIF